MEEEKKNDLSDYVQSKEAAEILGVSPNRLYSHLHNDRIDSHRVGKSFLMLRENVAKFRPNPSGRARTKPTPWSVFKSGIKVFVTEINVQVRPGQQQLLKKKLQEVNNDHEYTFPGTIARYIIQNGDELNNLQILLMWKGTDMPSEGQPIEAMVLFQVYLDEVLDWDTMQTKTNEALIYTK